MCHWRPSVRFQQRFSIVSLRAENPDPHARSLPLPLRRHRRRELILEDRGQPLEVDRLLFLCWVSLAGVRLGSDDGAQNIQVGQEAHEVLVPVDDRQRTDLVISEEHRCLGKPSAGR